jgi:hypothetical protein
MKKKKKTKKKKGLTPDQRIEFLAESLKDIVHEFPVDTKHKAIKLCIEYARAIANDEYNLFFLTEKYAAPRWKRICNEAASGRDGVFIKYIRERNGGSFIGRWDKVGKREYLESMRRDANDLATRVENYNYSKETAEQRWKNLRLPGFDFIPALPAGV